MREACGVFGIHNHPQASWFAYLGIYSLQHRGQESAGIAVSDGEKIVNKKGMGLVSQVFNSAKLNSLKGHIAIGHNRYSTTGSSILENAQPIFFRSDPWPFALAHNGNLANSKQLRKKIARHGICFNSSSDSELIGHLILRAKGKTFAEKIINATALLKGAYSVVILTPDKIYAIRDPLGIRPLVLGKLKKSWVVASESCAFLTIGAEFDRDIGPGEVIEISKNGVKTVHHNGVNPSAFCIFEYIYFSRPDSVLNGQLAYTCRLRTGRVLAEEHPAEADLVMTVPDSGTSAAIGFSQASGIPYLEGLIKNRYLGRTFIQPDQAIRDLGVRLKFNPLSEIINGKRLVLIDDSIVRGTTTKNLVKMLRAAGAKEIHLRIASPPLVSPCFLGIDIERYKELIAHRRTVDQIKRKIDVDSLGYVSLEGLKKAIGKVPCQFCDGCFTKKYPIKPPA